MTPDAPLTLDGQDVPVTQEVANGIGSYNYLADVTSILKTGIDAAAAGEILLPVGEPATWYVDGAILVVIFDDPAVTEPQSVTMMYGALSPSGDEYRVALAEPIDLRDPATRLEMSLGISYSYQTDGTQQFSTVNVNGQPLTGSAGGEDDGEPDNGALLTVGGLGDSPEKPEDPWATPTGPRSDDELYDLRPFVSTGDRAIWVATSTRPSTTTCSWQRSP